MNPKLTETPIFRFTTHSPETGANMDADSLPTCEVLEDSSDTAILAPTVVKRAATTGQYRVPIACTAANGFEAGKSYTVQISATVDGVTVTRTIATFQVRAQSVDDVTLADDALTANKIATGAIDADALAADAVQEIVAAIDGTVGGSGAYAVITTVLDADAVPVAGAAVRLRNLTSNDVANTDVDGLATLNKDAGTYTRIVTAAGYEAFTDTVVVDGDETLSDVELTAIVIEAAADELQCACYLYARDAGGAIETGKKHLFRLSALPDGDGSSYGPEIEATSDDAGLVEVDLLRGKTYLMQRGETWDNLADSSDQVTVEVPNNAGPFELPNVWSNDN